MHFSIKKSKRFFLKITRDKRNVYIRAEESYQNNLNKYQNICKGKKTVSVINPDVVKLYVDVKQEKLNDVTKLLIKHFGENWEEHINLLYFKQVLSRPKPSIAHAHEHDDEQCEFTEELPAIFV
ncbi:unnamed protein product [Parnassius apollo]|uniref:(apollo) hypothetical protein n=1 Tax=Parnassius apollo TaxID=110799 RepID=A0A8S3W7X8_PARAO|nr:unnamed protein product [Parnassius apollo]